MSEQFLSGTTLNVGDTNLWCTQKTFTIGLEQYDIEDLQALSVEKLTSLESVLLNAMKTSRDALACVTMYNLIHCIILDRKLLGPSKML